jgi:hypothetical protein
VTPTSGAANYTVDRWRVAVSQSSKLTAQQNAGAITPPAGFTNYLGITSSSAYSVLATDYFLLTQYVEGFNSADFAWGTANAQSVTLSFWVRSSLTGTFGCCATNSAGNRNYPFTYTISAANTWEQKTVTIPGDTTGTWLTTNGIGITLYFGLGVGSTYSSTAGAWTGTSNIFGATGATSVVGTNGATFYITGVQLEAGSVASPFERRDYGRELMMCQRYFAKSFPLGTAPVQNAAITAGALIYTTQVTNTQYLTAQTNLPVTMRASPTITTYNPFAANTGWSASGTGNYTATTYSLGDSSIALRNDTVVPSAGANMSIHWTASSEL